MEDLDRIFDIIKSVTGVTQQQVLSMGRSSEVVAVRKALSIHFGKRNIKSHHIAPIIGRDSSTVRYHQGSPRSELCNKILALLDPPSSCNGLIRLCKDVIDNPINLNKRKLLQEKLEFMNKLVELAEKIYHTNKENGWWDSPREHDTLFMLIVTELSKAVEADRSDLWADEESYKEDVSLANGDNDAIKLAYERYIKDTVEAELAGTVVRCLDYLYHRFRENIIIGEVHTDFTGNFPVDIFSITKTVTDRRIADAVYEIKQLANNYNIKLIWHIRETLRYNQMREKKHGGKKY